LVFAPQAPEPVCPIDVLRTSMGRGAEARPVGDEARRKRGEQTSLPSGSESRRLLRT